MRRMTLRLFFALAAGAASAATDRGDPADSMLCEAAARRAAADVGAPLEILRAIALAETGGGLGGAGKPWPWTTNVEGVGAWHPTREAAIAHIRRRQAEGARSYDVGCFQVNRRWHGHAFDSLEQMFDPDANARYAARFLLELKQEAGGWRRAAGWYHSRTPELAEKYRARVSRILAALPDAPAPAAMVFGAPSDRAGPGGTDLATDRMAPADRFDSPEDPAPSPGMLRRALPLFAAIAAAARPGGTTPGALMPLERSAEGPMLRPAQPLFGPAPTARN